MGVVRKMITVLHWGDLANDYGVPWILGFYIKNIISIDLTTKIIFFPVVQKSFLGGMLKSLQYYIGRGVPRDPQKWLRNMCTTPFMWHFFRRTGFDVLSGPPFGWLGVIASGTFTCSPLPRLDPVGMPLDPWDPVVLRYCHGITQLVLKYCQSFTQVSSK